MQNTLARMGFTSLVALFSFCFFVGQVESRTIEVNCDMGKTIQANGVDKANPGDVIQVSGTCNERVRIDETVNNITLDGQGTATIDGGSSTVVRVVGRGITIRGFTITDGNGVVVRDGGTVVIDDNSFTGNGGFGINVGRGSRAQIINNLIEDYNVGVQVTEGSSARIGFRSVPNVVAAPNIIRQNVTGIKIRRSSHVRIAGNEIIENQGDAISIEGVSHAAITDNDIEENGGNAVDVKESSGVNLGTDAGGDVLSKPNRTDTTNNNGFGIRCRIDGYASGKIGTLVGVAGGKNITDGCFDDVNP